MVHSIISVGAVYYWWRRQWHPTPLLLPGKSHGRRSLVGCSLWGRYESDMTEWLHFHFSLSCIGEGNGNPLQCSCLENPRDGGAWWAAVYGIAQSWTRLKRLSSSSSSSTQLAVETQAVFLQRRCLKSLYCSYLLKAGSKGIHENGRYCLCESFYPDTKGECNIFSVWIFRICSAFFFNWA